MRDEITVEGREINLHIELNDNSWRVLPAIILAADQ